MALTVKQQIFIEEYMRSFNATAAALAAGYSERTAYSIGHENLNKPEIADELKKRLSARIMSLDEALARTADIARGDLTQYLSSDGELDIERLRADGKGHLLKKYKTTRRVVTTKGGSEIETTTIEAELYAADAAHDKILRHHGAYLDRAELTGADGEPVEIRIMEFVRSQSNDEQ